MLYVALGLIVATGLFALMRILLRDKAISLQQFFVLYVLALVGLVLIGLGLSGRLHWLFALFGAVLPFFSGLTRWGIRAWRAAGVVRALRQLIAELTGLKSSDAASNRSENVSSPMTVAQALDILGLEGQPDSEQIKAAHRKMIQKLHPDRGGSTLLAKQVNEAKQVLLDHV